MTHSDPIADLLTRIRNAGLRNHETVPLPWFGLGEEIVRLLKEEGWIRDYSISGEIPLRTIDVSLKYTSEGTKRVPLMRKIQRVSKPSCRVYKKRNEIKPVHAGLGTQIISTSQGLLTDRDALLRGLGGEVLAEVL
ncbi:30S ribosomal protein S8 [bacterium]|nr:30S ribosomal protein S8 [bacterium]